MYKHTQYHRTDANMIIEIPRDTSEDSDGTDGTESSDSENVEYRGLFPSFEDDYVENEHDYCPPNLYEEADEMLQMSQYIYAITQLRTFAKKRQKRRTRTKKKKLPRNDDSESELDVLSTSSSSVTSSSSSLSSSSSSSSLEQILTLPLTFDTCINMIEDNFECIAEGFDSNGQDYNQHLLNATQLYYGKFIQRLQQRMFQKKNSTRKFTRWWNPGSISSNSERNSTVSPGIGVGDNKVAQAGNTATICTGTWAKGNKTKMMTGRNSVIVDDMTGKGEDIKPTKEARCDVTSPFFVAYGDDNPNKGLVYAITVDPTRKRITVVFRGSVNLSDFFAVTSIVLKHRPNPIQNGVGTSGTSGSEGYKSHQRGSSRNTSTTNCSNYIGIHRGFYKYLFQSSSKPATYKSKGQNEEFVVQDDAGSGKHAGTRDSDNKYAEILGILINLFEKHKGYKLYLTGHSLGGALATLFSFYIAANLASLGASPNSYGDSITVASTASTTTTTTTTNSNDNDINDRSKPSISAIPTPISCVSIASPRVGDQNFQNAYQSLERSGHLQHLRIVNDGDPVTTVPKRPATKLRTRPCNRTFKTKEIYHHTGMKLKLYRTTSIVSSESSSRDQSSLTALSTPSGNCSNSSSSLLYNYDCKIEYSGSNRKRSNQSNHELSSSHKNGFIKSLRSSFMREEIPYLFDHFGYIYHQNLKSVKSELVSTTIKDLYKQNMETKGESKI